MRSIRRFALSGVHCFPCGVVFDCSCTYDAKVKFTAGACGLVGRSPRTAAKQRKLNQYLCTETQCC